MYDVIIICCLKVDWLWKIIIGIVKIKLLNIEIRIFKIILENFEVGKYCGYMLCDCDFFMYIIFEKI